MKKLAVYLKDDKKECVLAPVFKLLEAGMDLLVPLVVADMLNHGVGGADPALLYRDFLWLLFLAAAGLLFSFTAQWFAAKAGVDFATRIRQAVFDHVQALSYKQLDKLGADTLITRMTSDVNQMQTGLNMALRLLLRSPFIVFGSLIMAFRIDVCCALVFAVSIPLLGAIIFGIMQASIPLYARAQEALDRLMVVARENLNGVRVIRAFNAERQETEAFEACSHEVTRLNELVGRLSAALNPLTFALINVATVFLIRTGMLEVHLGQIAQGDVVALYNYMAQMIVELIKLASLIIILNRALACAKRLEGVLEIKAGMPYGQEAEINLIEENAVVFRHVSFHYGEQAGDALSDISFTAKAGETIGIIGGTGSGKSSLLNLILRLYDADEGEISVFGKNVRSYAKGELPRRIGMVPQQAVLFAGTVRENMQVADSSVGDDEIWRALTIAQAKNIVAEKEGGLDAPVEQNGQNFSGGQRQRLTIARALVKDPAVLLLDDAASALDLATDLQLRKALRAWRGKHAVFIVSQRISGVKNADHILVLQDGRLVGDDTHENLLRSCGVYRELYASQNGGIR